MRYILQIFTGFRNASSFCAEDIIEKIGFLVSEMDIDDVIIGWGRDASAYRKIGSFLHGAGIRMLLWLPVFSEVSAEFMPDQAQDIFGNTISALDTREGEAFQFVCPSSAHNVRIVKDIYEQDYAGCGFDGVFLDRIRTQSFAAGVSGVLSCGCVRCRKAFLQKGVNIDDVRKAYEDQQDSFFDAASWPMNGEFVLENPLAQRFFEAKEEIIADAVTDITRYFKDKGLTVGLDLFAPVISRLVGQNYSRITRYADFIKPMLYRRTEAPAGVGYEYALMEKYAPKARGRMKLSPDLPFLRGQLEAIGKVSCEKYPGIEINYDKDLVRTDVGYIRESLAAVRDSGFEGAVLCWNVMQAPEEHLRAANLPL